MTDTELVKSAVLNAKAHRAGEHVRWACVADTFAIGSTSAMELCKRFNLNPEDMITGVRCIACDP